MESSFANVGNTHDVAPITSSKVGAVQGCGGPASSPEALQQEGVYRMASKVGGGKRRYYTLAGGKRHTKRRRLSKRRRPKTHRRRRHHRGGQHDYGAMRDTVSSGTKPVVSDGNTTSKQIIPYPPLVSGGKSHRRRRHHKKSRKHTRKHRRRGSRRMRGGDGVYAAALTPSYSSPGDLESSALASPPPIVRTNNCLDTYKHLGDKPPYNEEWKGIN